MKTSIRSAVLLALSIAALVESCADATGWYPLGEATAVGSYEYDDGGVRYLAVTATVKNTGGSTITRSTFTVAATTGARTYWKTVTSDTRILPGSSIKVTSALSYADAAETLAAGGLTVSDAFFE